MRPNPDLSYLRPADFSFVGFDHLLAPLEASLAQVGIRGGEPTAAFVDDAIFVPTTEVAPHQYDGALLTSDGGPIPQAMSERRKSRWGSRVLGSLSQPVALHPEQTIEEEVIYLGWYFDHFGHFLLESLARTWILPQLDRSVRVVFHAQHKPSLSGTMLRILELLGASRDRILFPERQTRFRRVIVPEPLYEISYAAHPGMIQPFRHIAEMLSPRDTPSEQPVYLSRRLLSSRQRAIVGEFAMEEVFRDNGFVVVHPETMTFADQVRLVNRHREIFTSAGSGAYMPLFALNPHRLHLLTAGIPFQDFFLVPKAAGIEASFGNCFTGGDRFAVHYAPLLARMDKLADYLDAAGMLQKRLRSSLSVQVLDLAPVYEEARWYRYLSTDARNNPLPAEVETEIARLAQTSWPLSWALARHSLGQDPDRVEPLAKQFIELVAPETDVGRLAHYHEDISRGLSAITQLCAPATAARLADVVRDRFQIDLAEATRRQAVRRLARQASRPHRDPITG